MLTVGNAECHLCLVSVMLSVTNKPLMLNVVMLSVLMLNVIMLNVVMLSVVMLSVLMCLTDKVTLSFTSSEFFVG
jgi:hypothetical protein